LVSGDADDELTHYTAVFISCQDQISGSSSRYSIFPSVLFTKVMFYLTDIVLISKFRASFNSYFELFKLSLEQVKLITESRLLMASFLFFQLSDLFFLLSIESLFLIQFSCILA
jgi:hypothetical protein